MKTPKEIAAKIVAILAAEKCSISESAVVLREVSTLIHETIVSAQEKD